MRSTPSGSSVVFIVINRPGDKHYGPSVGSLVQREEIKLRFLDKISWNYTHVYA